jgi:hypothetical protein
MSGVDAGEDDNNTDGDAGLGSVDTLSVCVASFDVVFFSPVAEDDDDAENEAEAATIGGLLVSTRLSAVEMVDGFFAGS